MGSGTSTAVKVLVPPGGIVSQSAGTSVEVTIDVVASAVGDAAPVPIRGTAGLEHRRVAGGELHPRHDELLGARRAERPAHVPQRRGPDLADVVDLAERAILEVAVGEWRARHRRAANADLGVAGDVGTDDRVVEERGGHEIAPALAHRAGLEAAER